MLKNFLVILLLLFTTGPGMAETRDVQGFFDQNLGDFKTELATARKEGKIGILLMYELEDCPFCHRMKGTILNQSEVQDYYRKHFIIFSVDINGDNPLVDFSGKETTEKKFAAEQRVRATPVFGFYDLDGKPMTRYTGASKDEKEFMLLGRYVAEGLWKTMPFAKYKQQAAK
ncbi:MAG: thioredoxin family protein [Gammaproteobacteria bacterium]|nr:thioredoxin family protein [Gammaproteobacteria bacterium]MBU1978548.1 thioredoxin family protein [Gammaproteobacteria bacterium]